MAKRVIALLGQPVYNEDGIAGEALTPGHLVDGVTTILKHASAGAACPRTFALERDEMGTGIDTAYAVDDTVKVGAFHQGERVYAFLASGQNVAINARLESAGNGCLKVFGSGVILARAREAVNATTGASRITIEIM